MMIRPTTTVQRFVHDSGLIIPFIMLILLFPGAGKTLAQTFTYSETFTSGVAYSSSDIQWTHWSSFIAQLTPRIYTSVTIKGSNDAVGVSVSDQTVATAIANALYSGSPGSWITGGRTWAVGNCGSGLELSATGSVCACPNPGYIVRPHIANTNWGGVNSATCSAGTQTMTVIITSNIYTFTNAGATGRTGPTQAQVNAAYSGTTLAGNVTINTQGIQEWTVPATNIYRIRAQGAGGGANYYTQRVRGGYGTEMAGDFTLTAGQVLKIVIGQRGLDGTIDDYAGSPSPQEAGGSGGGTSFVTLSDNTALIVAGGGGGATTRLSYAGAPGGDALTGTGGGSGSVASPGVGGTGGSGGGGCSNPGFQGGSGGGGLTGNGGNSEGAPGYGSINYGGYSFVSNATGGVAGTGGSVGVLRNGGFGGGGCGGYTGGGGGGYSGGGAGGDGGSGGGGSYNGGTSQSNTAVVQPGNGIVIISSSITSAPANPTSVTASVNPICSGFSTLLTANGADGTVYWYTGSCGGTQVSTGNTYTVNPTATTAYYARNYNNSQFSTGCASLEVTVNQPSYVATPPTVASLQATGSGIKWYAAPNGGTALTASTQLTGGDHYYASQTVNGCESHSRFEITATVDATPCKPAGSQTQSFSAGATVANLSASGSSIRWYYASSGGSALPSTTVLINAMHYWASQTIDYTESATRLEVTVTIN